MPTTSPDLRFERKPREDPPLILPTPAGYQFAVLIAREVQKLYPGCELGDLVVPVKYTEFGSSDGKAELLASVGGRNVYVVTDVYSTATRSPRKWYGWGAYKLVLSADDFTIEKAPDRDVVKQKIPAAVNWSQAMSACNAAHASIGNGSLFFISPCWVAARQDSRNGRESANLWMSFAGLADEHVCCAITMDIHNTKGSGNAAEQLRMGYRNLDATRYQIEYARQKFDGNSLVVIGPDTNALERTRRFARALGTSEGVFDKERSRDPNELTEHTRYIGACMRGKRALSADDMADSLGTIKKVEGYCRQEGAVSLDLIATHALLSHPAIPRLTEMHEHGIFGSLAMTNTVTHERGEDVLEHYRLPANVETIEVQAAFADMVYRTHNDFSTNPLLTDRR